MAARSKQRSASGAVARAAMAGALLSGACGSSKPPAVGTMAAATVEVPGSTPGANGGAGAPAELALSRAPCERLHDLVERGRATFPEGRAPDALPCLEGKGGAYALVIRYKGEATDAESHGGGDVGSAVLVHAHDSGTITKSHELGYERSALASTTFRLEGSADYDGDGTDELLLVVSEWVFESHGSRSGSVWQVKGSRIERYAPAQKFSIASFEDLDGDRLPDLVTDPLFQGEINGCGPDGEYIEFGPRWVAHAAGGDFVWDAVSRAEVRRGCPEPPKAIVPRAPAGVDNDELRHRLACAIGWGVEKDAIVRELKTNCPAGGKLADECAYQGTLPICVNPAQLARWAGVKPPFFLP